MPQGPRDKRSTLFWAMIKHGTKWENQEVKSKRRFGQLSFPGVDSPFFSNIVLSKNRQVFMDVVTSPTTCGLEGTWSPSDP